MLKAATRAVYAAWRALWPTRTAYDLDLVDQWTVLTLQRFGDCSYRRVAAELAGIRGSTPAEAYTCLVKLENLALIERIAATELMVQERRFRLTRAGRRLAKLMPAAPRSPTIYYA